MFKILSKVLTPNRDERFFYPESRNIQNDSKVIFGISLIIVLYLFYVVWHEANLGSIFENKKQKFGIIFPIFLKSTKYPSIIWWTDEIPPETDETLICKPKAGDLKRCKLFGSVYRLPPKGGVYIFTANSFDFRNLPLPRNTTTDNWALLSTDLYQYSSYERRTVLTEKFLNLFNYSSTFSRHSDVPFPLHQLTSYEDILSTEYYVDTSMKNVYKLDILYLKSDLNHYLEVDKYVKELAKQQYVKTEFIFIPETIKNPMEFYRNISQYKFVVIVEDRVCEDYISFLFWAAINTGVVPIYFGSPTIRDWFPNKKSAILLSDYPSPKLLSEYIAKLDKNDDLYEEYLEHKTLKRISNLKLIKELKTRTYQNEPIQRMHEFLCFLCDALNKSGTTMDHKKHVVTRIHYNCSDSQKESDIWIGIWDQSNDKLDSECDDLTSSSFNIKYNTLYE